MSLYAIKPWFVARLRRIEDALVGRAVSADSLSYAAVVTSIVAGGALVTGAALDEPLVWLAVAPLCVVRLALNALDGSVARRTGTARTFGVVLNEVADRAADAALIGSLGFVVSPVLAVGAVAAAFGVSLTGVLALALTGTRATSGPMGKADRTAVVAAAATGAAVTGSTVFLVAGLTVILVGSLGTAARRVRALHREVGTHVSV
jgi:CDP-diacylglycerol--glycerol-3-phosphate 3-phosphatidyltransferase